MHVGRNRPGHTWQDVLDDIDTPCVDTPVALEMAVLPLSYLQLVDSDPSYRQVKLEAEGEYNIVVEARNAIWVCGPFRVFSAPRGSCRFRCSTELTGGIARTESPIS
jgi:hypothetical protein